MNILISTFGTSWQIIPEILGFTNPYKVNLYKNHSGFNRMIGDREKYNIENIQEVWLVTTDNPRTADAFKNLCKWHENFKDHFQIKVWKPLNISELSNDKECKVMRDLIYRLVLTAVSSDNQWHISLAGGRKTMSADIQQAAFLFGCSPLLHVVDVQSNWSNELRDLKPQEMAQPLKKELAELINPIVISSKMDISSIIEMELKSLKKRYGLPCSDINHVENSTGLADMIEQMQIKAFDLQKNYREKHISQDKYGNFHELYLYPPHFLEKLKSKIIGEPENQERDRRFINALPKTDLHCHFGAVLSVKEAVEIASKYTQQAIEHNRDFQDWYKMVEKALLTVDIEQLRELTNNNIKGISFLFPGITPPYAMTAFLSCFKDREDVLEKLIYGDYTDESSFFKIGIEKYERLGDFQGSGLLQSEIMIRQTCRKFMEYCKRNNIWYTEVRCSPENYTKGGLSGRKVVEIMLDELCDDPDIMIKLMFIASRHGKMSFIYKHIELFEELSNNEKFLRNFAGFDLAGAETIRRPAQLRSAFQDLHKKCIHTTIHAGEGDQTDNIWEAIYSLNADRIGHGLSLSNSKELLKKFIDQRIAVELCPSSNYQIIGFRDRKIHKSSSADVYPLLDYLISGV